MKKTYASIVKLESCDWKNSVKGKWILLDSNTVLNLIKYDSNSFLRTINKLDVTLLTLQPIVLELNRTNSRLERIKRNAFLNNNVVVITPDNKIMKDSCEIQEQMWLEGYFPEPEDLYLASTLKKFANGKTLLATSNLDDFREPMFEKISYILLKNEKSVCVISLLAFTKGEK